MLDAAQKPETPSIKIHVEKWIVDFMAHVRLGPPMGRVVSGGSLVVTAVSAWLCVPCCGRITIFT